jgi:diguanylate cyclase (GGDEF)-like protein
MDISDIKNSGINLILIVIAFTMMAILLIMYIANRILKPHLDMLEELSQKIKNISNGIFTNIIVRPNFSIESVHLVNEYNRLVNGLSHTFADIDKKLNVFIGNESHESNNPLLNSQKVIGNLSELYKFKKEIEIDATKEEIYNRISQVLSNRFNIKNYNFLERDNKTNKLQLVFTQGDQFYCSRRIFETADLCRASRNNADICSIQGHQSCQYFINKNKFYYCLTVDIGEYAKFIINFVLESQQELTNLKKDIPLIKNYILEAAPSLTVKLLLEELKANAFKDGLTGLYNRKFLDEYLTKLLPQARREEFNIGVLMLDMDHFKSVNDEYGHDVGDIVLKELAKILKENIRESDIVVRYGGEEFLILLKDINDEKAIFNVADKIRNKVKENEINIYAGNKLQKTVSIGFSIYPADSTNFEVVMKHADIALYEAKENGRDQVVQFKEKVEIELF